LLKHYKNIPDEIEINNSEVPYKSDENEYLNCSPKEKEKFEKFIKEKENSILKKAKYIEKEILKNEQE
jgi:folate-dependent tRNA-U54 methylase TrmFO/GidA